MFRVWLNNIYHLLQKSTTVQKYDDFLMEEEMIGAIDPETSPNGGITIYDQNIQKKLAFLVLSL